MTSKVYATIYLILLSMPGCAHVTVEGGAACTYLWGYRILLQNRHRRNRGYRFKDDYRLWNRLPSNSVCDFCLWGKDDLSRRSLTITRVYIDWLIRGWSGVMARTALSSSAATAVCMLGTAFPLQNTKWKHTTDKTTVTSFPAVSRK